ncbi:MAG: hypothetical protein RLZ10_3 [Bacteroidota bacterium]|jgi:hypothetical protein
MIKINWPSFIIFWTGLYAQMLIFNHILHRNGPTLYNFCLYLVTGISWGYYWGQHLFQIINKNE